MTTGKIAIFGTAPQWKEGPLEDKSWTRWAVSGCWKCNPERLYEIHAPRRFDEIISERQANDPGYIDFAKSLGKNFIIQGTHEEFPEATAFDFDKYRKKHGDSPFSSTIAWMLADAIYTLNAHVAPKEIGIWGVNMAHDREYGHQKPGCRELIGWAKALNIKITVPDSSELMAIPWLYALQEQPHSLAVLDNKIKEIAMLRRQSEKQMEIEQQTINFYKGAEDIISWVEQNFYRAS